MGRPRRVPAVLLYDSCWARGCTARRTATGAPGRVRIARLEVWRPLGEVEEDRVGLRQRTTVVGHQGWHSQRRIEVPEKLDIAVVRFWDAYSGAPPADAEVEARRRAGYAALDAMERHLSNRAFHVGERFTIADISLYAYTHAAAEGGFDLAGYRAIRAWLDRVAGQPGHAPIEA